MEKTAITSSTLSLNRRSPSWESLTRSKFPSLNDLSSFNYDDPFLTSIPNDDIQRPFGTSLVWKAVCKLVRAAWKKSKIDLNHWQIKGDEADYRERSVLIQLASVGALVAKDREILNGQSVQLETMNRTVVAVEKETLRFKERNAFLTINEKTIHDQIANANWQLKEENRHKSELEMTTQSLETVLKRRQNRVDELKNKIDLKNHEIDDLVKKNDDIRLKIRNASSELERAIWRKSDIGDRLNKCNRHLERLVNVLRDKIDRNDLLFKHLREMREINKTIADEYSSLLYKFGEQDETILDLEKMLKGQREELEAVRVGLTRNSTSRIDKMIFGVWATTCAMHIVKSVDIRWT